METVNHGTSVDFPEELRAEVYPQSNSRNYCTSTCYEHHECSFIGAMETVNHRTSVNFPEELRFTHSQSRNYCTSTCYEHHECSFIGAMETVNHGTSGSLCGNGKDVGM